MNCISQLWLSSYYNGLSGKLGGMNATTAIIDIGLDAITSENTAGEVLTQSQSKIEKIANFGQVPSSKHNTRLFTAQTLSNKCDVLLSVQLTDDNKLAITVNCEKIVIGSMLIQDIRTALLPSTS